MRILIIGDIVGRPGRKAVQHLVAPLVRERGIGAVIANAENVAGGSGLTPPLFGKLRHHGVDAVTLGDHVYRRREVYPLLSESDRVVRPANLAPEATGRTHTVFEAGGVRVGLFCLLGRLYMKYADCPYRAADAVLGLMPPDVKVILVDFHAEATSEKVAMGHYLTGRVSAVVGTHTHIQTADECVLSGRTAYITDLGMTGPYDSVLGRDKAAVIASLISTMPYPFNVASGDVRLCGALLDVDETTGSARSIERVRVDLPPGLD